jgi:sigma-B regulation protein RsbU (phosphoserine phosphatase)
MPTRFRYRLPEGTAPAGGAPGRLRDFARRRAGKVLLGSLLLLGLQLAGVPLPDAIYALNWVVLLVLGPWGIYRLGRYLVRTLLWRIRSKLLVSYLFIAVVPLVLLTLFFALGGFLALSLVASYTVSSEVERAAQDLLTVAKGALPGPRADAASAGRELEERLAQARALYPRLAHALGRDGRTLFASPGEPMMTRPEWLKDPAFAGLVRMPEAAEGGPAAPAGGPTDDEPEERPQATAIRALWTQNEAWLLLSVPMDETLFAELKRRTGIVAILDSRGGAKETKKGITITIDDDDEETGRRRERIQQEFSSFEGVPFIAVPEITDWATGKTELKPIAIRYSPSALVRRLSPRSIDIGGALLKAMAVVGGLFLVVYCVALVLGLLLARSITRSIHALSVGTERLRQGDFAHPIPIQSRDQLGDLAESFNVMAHGIQDLLREQAEKERLEEELRIARQIQMSLLPQNTVGLPGLRIAALCLPAAEVGGDYYDLLPLSDARMGVLVADVSGKGTSAALYMAELKGLVLSLSRIHDSPARLLAEANRILAANMDTRSFITMTYAVVDTAARTLRYARAGHNPLIHLEAATGRTHVLAPQGIGLGMDRGERFEEVLEEAEVKLAQGDVFLFFTDGLSEAMNDKAELFGEQRLRDVIEQAETLGTDDLKDRILDTVRDFVGGAAQHDDMTMVILKVA